MVDEGVRNGAAFTFARWRRCPINRLWHLTRRRQTEAIEVVARMAAHVIVGVTAVDIEKIPSDNYIRDDEADPTLASLPSPGTALSNCWSRPG